MDTQLSSNLAEDLLVYEETVCDGCGSRFAEQLLRCTDLLTNLGGDFALVRCEQCGLIRQNPRLAWESLKLYYPQEYRPYQAVIPQEQSIIRRFDRQYGMQKRVRAVARHKPDGNLLDVGCGTGIFLSEAQRKGLWQLQGLEPNTSAAEYAQANLNVPIIQARFEDARLEELSFDVITMWNVLEHLEEPISALRKAIRLLKPGGLLVFSIPNLECPSASLFKNFWLGWDQPRHLYLFPRFVLEQYLSQIGYRIVEKRCIAGSHAMLGISLSFVWQGYRLNPVLIQLLNGIYQSYPVRLVMAPLFFIGDRLKQCSLLTWFMRKS